MTAPDVPVAAVPPARRSAGALARYRAGLERRVRRCPPDASRRAALRAALADVLAEDAERRRIDRGRQAPPGSA